MSRSEYEPLRDPVSLRQAMDQLFEQSFVSPRQVDGQRQGRRAFPVDIYMTPDAYILQASVPGVEPNDVQITYEDGVLSIQGETRAPTGAQSYLVQERRFGPFERVLRLELPIQADKIEASFDNGVLTVTLPKAEQAKPKKIQVKRG